MDNLKDGASMPNAFYCDTDIYLYSAEDDVYVFGIYFKNNIPISRPWIE